MLEIFGGIVVLAVMVILSGIRVVKEHDRLVVYRFGKVIGSKGTGVQFIVPLIDKVQSVDMRIHSVPLKDLNEETADRYAVNVSAFCMFHVNDPAKAVSKIDDPVTATIESARAATRLVIGQQCLRDIMDHRRILNSSLKVELECRTRQWGVKIKSFELTQIKVYDKKVFKLLSDDQIDEITSSNGDGKSKPEELEVRMLSSDEVPLPLSSDLN